MCACAYVCMSVCKCVCVPMCMCVPVYVCVILQKLLLLPELSGTAITGTNSDPVKITSRSHSPNVMPTLELVNEESIGDHEHESLPNTVSAKILVNGLTASWTHVRN